MLSPRNPSVFVTALWLVAGCADRVDSDGFAYETEQARREAQARIQDVADGSQPADTVGDGNGADLGPSDATGPDTTQHDATHSDAPGPDVTHPDVTHPDTADTDTPDSGRRHRR